MNALSAVQLLLFAFAASLGLFVFRQLRGGLSFSYEDRRQLSMLRQLVLAIVIVLAMMLFALFVLPTFYQQISEYLLMGLLLAYSFALWLLMHSMLALRTAYRQQVRHRQEHDMTTGLPNRASAYRYLESQLQPTGQGRRPVVMVLLLSGISFVDDRYGLGTAELVISEVCRRVHISLRRTDFVARVSEHAFLVFIQDMRKQGAARTVAEHIVNEVKKPIELAQHAPSISPHIGVLQAFELQGEVAALVRRAQLVAVSAQHRGMSVLFDTDMDDYSRSEQVDVLEDWHQALTAGELELYYQPQMNLHTGQVVGAEALLRFPTKQGFSLDNKDFSTLLAQSGLTHELNRFVFTQLLRQVREWQNDQMHVPIGFNVSIRSFQNHQFVSMLSEALQADRALAHNFKIEITESESADSMAEVIRSMISLAQSGVQFSIDDFGTRYASMEYLQQLPIHEVKIDKSFVLTALNDQTSADIVKASIELARKLGFTVVAEGVETEEIKDWLVSLGCEYGQGYYFAAPMPADAFRDWVLEA